MATTTIPWGDGSGDNIYLTYPSASGDQTVTVSSDANTGAARTKTVTFTAGNITQQLTVNQVAGLPYTPLEYIQTDGTAYINTGINSANSISAKLKALMPSTTKCIVLGRGPDPGSSQNAGTCILLMCETLSGTYRAVYVHRYKYIGSANPSIDASVTNQTPFDCRSSQKTGSQGISISFDGGENWTTRTSTQNSNYGSTGVMYLFRSNSNTPEPCPSGTRIYYCQIFNSANYTNLVFDGVPCLYNGQYGLWDNVSNSFFGNAAGSGAFTGPAIN